MIQSHMRIALNLGMNESNLNHLISLIENAIGAYEVKPARTILAKLTGTEVKLNTVDSSGMFAKGSRAPAERFTGVVWVNMLVQPTESFGHSTGVVTFEPGARTNWHMHPGGQVLLVTNGRGYIQEKGKSIKVIQKGDVIKCPPGIAHWHGASPDSEMSHVAISANFEKGSVVWLEKVTDEQYKIPK